MDCGKCSKNVSDAEVIKCTSCLTLMHFFCADLSESDFKRMLPMNRKKWKCSSCKNKKNAAPALSVSPKSGLSSSLSVDTETLTKYMDAKLADLRQQWRDDLNTAISEVTRKFRDDISSLESRMSIWEDRLSQVEDQMACNESLPTNLLEENVTLRTQLETLTSKFDDLDQASRSCNVEIQNIPEKKGENLVQLSLAIGKLLCVDLKDCDIRSVHRIAPGLATDRPKNIIMQLTTRRQRDELIAAARARRSLTTEQLFGVSGIPGVSSRFFIAEHLTLKNKILFSKARQIAKEKNYKFVWVKNSCIFVRKSEESKVIQLRSKNDLEKLI